MTYHDVVRNSSKQKKVTRQRVAPLVNGSLRLPERLGEIESKSVSRVNEFSACLSGWLVCSLDTNENLMKIETWLERDLP